MRLILILSHVFVTFYQTNGSTKEHDEHTTEGSRKGEEDASASNSSYYSTREMREMCLKEWAGKTQEVQEYFDQLPSEEFKENSEALKLMHYYEKKGMKDVDSKQIYNITPHARVPTGPEYTIEVNDSYVPKYRITPSEEKRMEKYGTFNSPEDSSEESEEGTTLGSVTTEPPDSEGEKPGGKKKRKKWPPHMDPKGKVKRRKKKKTLKADEINKKKITEERTNIHNRINLKEKTIREENKYLNNPHNNYQLGVLGMNKKTNNIEFEDTYRENIENVVNRKQIEDFNRINLDGKFKGSGGLKPNTNRQKHVSIFDSFMTSCKLKHKHKDHNHQNRNLSRSRQRSWSYNHHLQPFL